MTSAQEAEHKPRILIIVQNLPVPFDRRVWLECRALTAAGYDISVVCPKGKGDPAYEVDQVQRFGVGETPEHYRAVFEGLRRVHSSLSM